MGHLGFSYVGLIFLLMLTIPNLLWTKHPPRGYSPKGECKILVALERIGQVLVTCTALAFSDFNLRPWSAWSLWLIAAFAVMALYELWWFRYFRGEKRLEDFYSSFFGVPVAGATLPVIAFLMLGLYGKVIWLILAITILGIGHIGIHLQHRHALAKEPAGSA